MRLMRVLVALTIVGGSLLTTGLVPTRVLAEDAVVSGDDCNWNGLAAAINAAKSTTDGGGTVTFDCADPTIEFIAEIVIDANVTIDGSNGDGPSMILDGVADDAIDTRIFNVNSESANLSLENLTLQHASKTSDLQNWQLITWGGAIYNAGHLNISRVSFIDNLADRGGAIANGTNLGSSPISGSLTISESSFVDNTAQQIGGAIFTSMDMTIARSSFVGNAGSDGGALYVFEGDDSDPPQIQITSSTFSENTATQGAFDVHVDRVWRGGSVEVSWSTFYQPNDADASSLVVIAVLGVTLTGLIFGGGNATILHCAYLNAIPSISHVLSNDGSCAGDPTVDLLLGGQTTMVVNGVTQYYYPLLEGSPALNTGGTDCPTPDQLGTTRPVGSQCDIGAFEFPGNPPSITEIDAPASANEGEDVAVSVTATDTDGDTLHYWIDCENDGTWALADSTSNSTTCNYQDNGDFTIKVQVSDGATTASDTRDISIANVNPAITSFTVNPELAQLNQMIRLGFEATDVEGDLPLTATYFCDGSTAPDNTCTFSAGGTYTVGVTVSDGDGGSDSETREIFVNSRPAIDSTSVESPAYEGGDGVTITINASDVDDDALHYWIDCTGDGIWELEDSTGNTVDCVYPNQGAYDLAVQVSDGSAAPVKRTYLIGVSNAAPKITQFIATPNPALTGQPVVLSTIWTDVPADEPNITLTYECGDGEQLADDTCSFSTFGSHEVSVTADDHEGGVATRTLTIQVIEPVSLCVNQWTGQLREASEDGCGRDESLIELPTDTPLQLCVNQWNGQARVSDACGRSEYAVTVHGTSDVSVCVNRWNGTIRVSDTCTRSEHQEWL